ncbi:hypothetical protein [Mycolicibacterium houstonense]|uniref:hypothetical protein n=1 Tax=Mycolicibacterium houstonense TaxID=146021 RepID=UPI000A626BD2|nr:hypothetical protein [Mycolicibacterium houstonense]
MRTAVVAAAAFVAALFLAPAAHAEPDTHVPNGDALWCWGGKGTAGLVTPYCHGEPFPDGTQLRQTGYMQGMLQPLGWNPPECFDAAGAPAPNGCKG